MEVPDATVQPLILAQIQSAEAVGNAREIAAVDGIDVLFVGPADLTFDLKASGSATTYDACLTAVAEAAGSQRQAGGHPQPQ